MIWSIAVITLVNMLKALCEVCFALSVGPDKLMRQSLLLTHSTVKGTKKLMFNLI
jgi:hypothetical protein